MVSSFYWNESHFSNYINGKKEGELEYTYPSAVDIGDKLDGSSF